MKNQWVCDTADFGKYGLLRALCRPQPEDEYRTLRLAVIWYMTPDAPMGKKEKKELRGYLEPESAAASLYQRCDPPLYDPLRKSAQITPPDVGNIETNSVFPKGTRFFRDVIPYSNAGKNKSAREEWAKEALRMVQVCQSELVFVDPDNGLEPKPANTTKPKHVRMDELTPLARTTNVERSLVVYQHPKMDRPLIHQVRTAIYRMDEALERPTFAMVYGRHRGGGWVYFLVSTAPNHRERLLARARKMLDGSWGEHFLMMGW